MQMYIMIMYVSFQVADLSFNNITSMKDLSAHRALTTLLLNSILFLITLNPSGFLQMENYKT